MANIPYCVAKPISDVLNWPAEFYWAVFDVLTKYNGLGFLVSNPDFDDRASSYQVLKHVAFRTLPFSKVCEFIRVLDVIEGKPALGVAGYYCVDKTVKRAFKSLSEGRTLIKLRLPWNIAQTSMYGLSVPSLLKLIQVRWSNAIDAAEERKTEKYAGNGADPPSTKCYLADRGRLMLSYCIDFADHWKEAFDFLAKQREPIPDGTKFISKLSERCPSRREERDANQILLNRLNSKQLKAELQALRKVPTEVRKRK